ncbi:glutathionylspermidine synthase family protein [Bacillus sp. AGMB 02131]|uniref:Glutathionylspermidine synthase family protein n=1 Tax=Peribacillus faecalis TaxID=2772559 RepID=A0A927HCZ5_9BACI|nr:glutathionylspermidine synthase family protein [Peribacillus faecalis]MBD3110152.1 glutathionylspermidine synthase family protein [Peribacillus faecalis]
MYIEKRQNFYAEITEFWHDLYNTEYALFDVKTEKEETIKRIRTASERIARIFYKTSSLLRQLDDKTLLQLGYPAATLRYLRYKGISHESIIARLDLVVTKNKIKLLEFNSDTPTFIKECFFVNEYICRDWQLQNPNEGSEKQLAEGIREAVEQSLNSLDYMPNGKIVFTSHIDHEEDYLTTKYLLEISGLKAEFIPLHELQLVDEDVIQNGEIVVPRGLYTLDNERIDVLYRQTYPLEYLINDKDAATGASVGELLLQLVANRQLAIINPPSSFLLQSKAVMSLIWGLHEQKHSFYSEEEHCWIGQYFLPTFLDKEPFRNNQAAYVKKPSFGREGDTVSIYQADGTLRHEDAHKNYASELAVYQQYIDLPQIDIQTEQGIERASIMYGSFIINGKPSAIGIRAGSQITNNASYYLPVAICEQGENHSE